MQGGFAATLRVHLFFHIAWSLGAPRLRESFCSCHSSQFTDIAGKGKFALPPPSSSFSLFSCGCGYSLSSSLQLSVCLPCRPSCPRKHHSTYFSSPVRRPSPTNCFVVILPPRRPSERATHHSLTHSPQGGRNSPSLNGVNRPLSTEKFLVAIQSSMELSSAW